MAKIVVINGQGGTGKSTFVKFCKEHYPLVEEFSTVDLVKEAARIMGWDGAKDKKSRKFLSDLKDLLTNYNDKPFLDTLAGISDQINEWRKDGFDADKGIFFVHCREPEEIQRFAQIGAITLLIKRHNDAEYGNHADDQVFDYGDYDYTIYNNGTLDDLSSVAERFVQKILKI